MPYIDTIAPADATGDVQAMYARQQAFWNYVPDYALAFCHRPEVMARWGRLLAEINRPVEPRRREMITLAAALELRHTPCSLAHGAALAKLVGKAVVIAIAGGDSHPGISAAEQAMLRFARQVARDASAITEQDVQRLKHDHGFSDGEIFDIAAIAASRSFFTKLLDALGTEAGAEFRQIDADLRRALTVGRPIGERAPQRLGEGRAA